MKFLKKFLKNLWILIQLLFFLALGAAALCAPLCLAALFNSLKWLWLYLIYGVPFLALFVTWLDMKNGDY